MPMSIMFSRAVLTGTAFPPSTSRNFCRLQALNFLDPDDLVISVSQGGETRAYPTRILDRHEIVNDLFGTIPIAITYCPLCGSGLAFIRRVDGEQTEFGVSGLLHNNDLIMYDRKTESIWQQITGRSMAGPERGAVLEAIPVSMAGWSDWLAANPAGKVLAPPLGADQYKKNAYGDYANSDRLLFPVTAQDARLHVKKVIYGVEIDGASIAVDSDWLVNIGSWEYEVEGRIFKLSVNGEGGVSGSLEGQPLPVHRMFWFAWYSFHPDTSLIDERNH